MNYYFFKFNPPKVVICISPKTGIFCSLLISLAKPTCQAPTLTRREKEILILIAEGQTNHAIAEKLFVSPHTVDSHRKNLLLKFEVNNTPMLIKKAAGFGLE